MRCIKYSVYVSLGNVIVNVPDSAARQVSSGQPSQNGYFKYLNLFFPHYFDDWLSIYKLWIPQPLILTRLVSSCLERGRRQGCVASSTPAAAPSSPMISASAACSGDSSNTASSPSSSHLNWFCKRTNIKLSSFKLYLYQTFHNHAANFVLFAVRLVVSLVKTTVYT